VQYTLGFPVCYGSPSNVFAASSGFVHLYTLRFKSKEKRAAVVAKASVHKQGSSLLAELNFQPVSGLYKNFTRMSPSEFVFLINMIGEKISRKDTAFRKAISVQESLAVTLRFLANGDSYVSLKYLSCVRYTLGFPVCYGSPSNVFAASSGFCTQAGKCTAFQVCWQN